MSVIESIGSAPNYVAKLTDRVDSTNYEVIEAEAKEIISNNELESFVFDLNDVTYISSAGLRMFSSISKECRVKDVTYKLVGLSEDLIKIFRLTGYASTFKIEEKSV